ncbi:MAG: hypothetical protein V3V01_06500 [Acidimicrobiales bacterium]
MRRTWISILIASIALIGLQTPTALAEGGADSDPGDGDPGVSGVEGYFEGGGVFAGYQTPIVHSDGPGRPATGGDGPKYLCSFFIWDDGVGTDPAYGLIPGHYYVLRCHVEGEDELALNTPIILPYNPANPDGNLIVTQPEVDQAARNDLEFDAPGIETSPPVDKLVVGFETWFHNADTIDGRPALPVPTAKTASAGLLWATATAQPAFTDFDAGDDQPDSVFTCDEVVAPFDRYIDLESQRPDCARYAYQYSSNNDETPGATYTITAVVSYAVYLQTSANPNLVFQEELQGDTTELIATVTQLQAVIN